MTAISEREQLPEVATWRAEARAWLESNAQRKSDDADKPFVWGQGSDSVAVFHNLAEDDERALLERFRTWHQRKCDAGYGAITWPVEFGGAGLTRAHERAFTAEEARFRIPPTSELLSVTTHLIAPTINVHGTPEQRERFLRPLNRLELFACQLFSEPGAGSDLANLSCRADRDGDEWVLNGQKVWSSGARFADWGELIARSDVNAPKHKGMTAFLVPFDAPGVEVRPIRQMSGGASFNEVFFTDVRIPDSLRLGGEGEGWRVALTTLGFERAVTGTGGGAVGGTFDRVLGAARHLDRASDPAVRQALADLWIHRRLLQLNIDRVRTAAKSGQAPGPEGSIGKLAFTEQLRRISDVVSLVLGAHLTADTGEWGIYCWTEHLLGAPGYRIAGGSDEIQRNLIGERVLGLPAEPRVDRDISFAELQRQTRG